MAKKIKLTRPELKRQREALARFERYLPMLKLKQQQLQLTLRSVANQRDKARSAVVRARKKFQAYSALLADKAGIDVQGLAKPADIETTTSNIAGVNIPTLQEVVFPRASYSLFATPAWVDQALADLRDLNRRQVELDIITQQYRLLRRELTKITQRVNLFEKVKIPEAREDIRIIRIHLGDEMTAAVGRAKIAKAKLAETGAPISGPEEEPAATSAQEYPR
ncbi:MAG: V-type ATP synthase subunit D [Phycisphaerae bacterium]|nr:V-type ATP synthase subunit D [Phycisphaerae bacterium]